MSIEWKCPLCKNRKTTPDDRDAPQCAGVTMVKVEPPITTYSCQHPGEKEWNDLNDEVACWKNAYDKAWAEVNRLTAELKMAQEQVESLKLEQVRVLRQVEDLRGDLRDQTSEAERRSTLEVALMDIRGVVTRAIGRSPFPGPEEH